MPGISPIFGKLKTRWFDSAPGAASLVQISSDGSTVSGLQPNVANGYAKLNSEGILPATVVHRIGTDAEISAIDLEDGEFAYVTDLKEFRRGDGVTPGGIFCGSGGVRSVGNKSTVERINTDQQIGIQDTFDNLKAGGVYRLTGSALFQDDPDSISNFKVTINGVQGAFLSDPSDVTTNTSGIRSALTGQWNYSTSSEAVQAASMSLGQLQTFTPKQLTFTSAQLTFVYLFTCRTAESALFINHYTRVPPSTSNPIGVRRGYILERLQ